MNLSLGVAHSESSGSLKQSLHESQQENEKLREQIGIREKELNDDRVNMVQMEKATELLQAQLKALVQKQETISAQYNTDVEQKKQQIETLTRQLQSVILDNKALFQEMEILKEKFQ